MADRNEKSKALETALSQIEKNFGKGAIMRLGAHGQVANLAGLREVTFGVKYSV